MTAARHNPTAIKAAACKACGATDEEAYGRIGKKVSMNKRGMLARTVAAYILSQSNFSTIEIAALLGLRSHSTSVDRIREAYRWIATNSPKAELVLAAKHTLALADSRKEFPSFAAGAALARPCVAGGRDCQEVTT